MLYIVLGLVASILLWKVAKRWRHARREAEFVREALAPYAGLAELDVGKPTHKPSNFSAAWDLLWGAALVVALLVFAFVIAARISH